MERRSRLGLAHGLAQIPVHDGAAVAVEDRAQIEERAGHFQRTVTSETDILRITPAQGALMPWQR